MARSVLVEHASLTPTTVCAVVPVYNHPTTIGAVVATLRAHALPVILVDDGGDTHCATVLLGLADTDAAVSLHRCAHNGGKGQAVMTGARLALAAGYSHMLQIDADGQHGTATLADMLACARAQPTAFVMGVPRFDDSMPRSRQYGRWLTHGLVWLETLSLSIRDAMCGFRIYPLAPLVALADRQALGTRMDFDIEVAVRLVWDGMPVAHVPVSVGYPADGISHFHLWRDNVRISWMHTRLVCGMLLRLPLLLCQRLQALVARP